MTRVTRPSRPGCPGAGWLCRALPQCTPAFLALVDGCGADPGEPAVLMDLAEAVSEALSAIGDRRRLGERVLDAVEARLDLVALAFFDSFSPSGRSLLLPDPGPRARGLADALDLPDADGEVAP